MLERAAQKTQNDGYFTTVLSNLRRTLKLNNYDMGPP